MSYDGRIQVFCTQGHLTVIYDDYERKEFVCACGAAAAVENSIDDTNCEEWGIIPPDVLKTLLLKDAQFCTCSYCGNVHQHHPAVYRVLSPQELHKLRHFRDEDEYVLISKT